MTEDDSDEPSNTVATPDDGTSLRKYGKCVVKDVPKYKISTFCGASAVKTDGYVVSERFNARISCRHCQQCQ